ncbi:hypothetical protein [Brumimicrobium mesophilum]|uniref:hypothetical protein n=1 Tax=Brumimicrobium mesophilum TaxID=392717 RepID=UPI000D14289B|nr:hypothetical protein [Brumimicrobium mesophilum]
MSEENKNIDQLFRDAAQAEKAPQYNKAYWNEMNAMLNARDARKKAFLLWAFGGSAAFAVLLFSLFALNMDDSTIEQRYAREEVNLNIEKLNHARIENSNQQENLNISNEFNAVENSTINDEYESKNLKNNVIAMKENGESVRSSAKKSKNSVTYTNTNELNNLKSETENLSQHADKVLDKNLNAQFRTSAFEKINYSLPYEETNQLSQSSSGNIIQSTSNVKAPIRYILYTKFNAGLMENYKTSRPFESRLFDLSLNLEINMNHVLLRTGLGTQLTSNADLIVSQRKTINGTTVINQQKDLSYQNLFDIYIPLEFGYELNNTSFGIGAQVNYLMTTSMNLNNYENKILVNTTRQYGNRNGLNSFSTQGYIWIEQRFTPTISLGLKTGTNISGRIKDGAYFNESATTNPIYGQLSLRMNLLK